MEVDLHVFDYLGLDILLADLDICQVRDPWTTPAFRVSKMTLFYSD